MQRTIHAVIRPGEQSGYVAECPVLNAVTEGETLDVVARNLRESSRWRSKGRISESSV